MKLTISDAARVCRVARSTLQRAVSAGRLSLDANHQVDTAELLRAGYTLHDARHVADRSARQAALQDAAPRGRSAPADAPGTRQADAALVAQALAALERENVLLRATLDAALAREHTAQEREALLLRMLHESQQRNDRLLEAPRPVPQTPWAAGSPETLTPPGPPGRTEPPPRVVDVTTRMPAYNPTTQMLGALCKRGHAWQGTGQSLRRRGNQVCVVCDAEGQRRRRRGPRQADERPAREV